MSFVKVDTIDLDKTLPDTYKLFITFLEKKDLYRPYIRNIYLAGKIDFPTLEETKVYIEGLLVNAPKTIIDYSFIWTDIEEPNYLDMVERSNLWGDIHKEWKELWEVWGEEVLSEY